jgi:stress-induced morphogen
LTPGVINQPDFAGAELMAGNLCSKTFAGMFVSARNRHQVLHSRLRADLSKTNILLHGFGQFTYKRQPA